jgi:hypothetical protein
MAGSPWSTASGVAGPILAFLLIITPTAYFYIRLRDAHDPGSSDTPDCISPNLSCSPWTSDDDQVRIENISKAIASAAPLKNEDKLVVSESTQVKEVRNSGIDLSGGTKDSVNQTIAKVLI